MTLFSFEYDVEAPVEVKEKMNLTTNDVIEYISNRLLSLTIRQALVQG